MEKVLFTFFGAGNYKDTNYYIEDPSNSVYTKYVAVAINHFFRPNKIVLITTSKIKNESFEKIENIKNEIGIDDDKFFIQDIPEGKDQTEQEEIFIKITEIFEKHKDAEIYVDITHGFRSLPLIFFTSVIYLKNIYNVNLRKILYGAFEAKKDNNTPIFDLTFLLELASWSSAVNLFVNKYDAHLLRQRLIETQDKFYKEDTSYNQEKPKLLKELGNKLHSFSNEFLNVRPIKVAYDVKQVKQTIGKSKEELSKWAVHILPMLDKINEEIEKFYIESPKTLDKENLLYQIRLVDFYINKNLLLQAILLLRELIISLTLFKMNKTENWLDRDVRETIIGSLLNRKNIQQNTNDIKKYEEYETAFNNLDFKDRLSVLWDKIKEKRNIFAHCGMRNTDDRNNLLNLKKEIEALKKEIESIIKDT